MNDTLSVGCCSCETPKLKSDSVWWLVKWRVCSIAQTFSSWNIWYIYDVKLQSISEMNLEKIYREEYGMIYLTIPWILRHSYRDVYSNMICFHMYVGIYRRSRVHASRRGLQTRWQLNHWFSWKQNWLTKNDKQKRDRGTHTGYTCFVTYDYHINRAMFDNHMFQFTYMHGFCIISIMIISTFSHTHGYHTCIRVSKPKLTHENHVMIIVFKLSFIMYDHTNLALNDYNMWHIWLR